MPNSTRLIPQWSTHRWDCAINFGRTAADDSGVQTAAMTGATDAHPVRLITFRRPPRLDPLLLTGACLWGGAFGWHPVK